MEGTETPVPVSPEGGADAPQPPTARSQRPIGQPRGIGFVIVLSIVTLGIYTLYWAYKTFDEMKNYSGQGIGGVLGLVIQLLLGIVNVFLVPYEVREMYEGDGETSPVRGLTGLWILIPIAGWFVWIVKVQRALNAFWESRWVPEKQAAELVHRS